MEKTKFYVVLSIILNILHGIFCNTFSILSVSASQIQNKTKSKEKNLHFWTKSKEKALA